MLGIGIGIGFTTPVEAEPIEFIARDTFTGHTDQIAMTTADTTETGQTWEIPIGAFRYRTLSGGVLESNSALPFNVCVVETGVSDCDISAVTISGGNAIGLCFRYVDANNHFRCAYRGADRFGQITQVLAGVATSINSTAGAIFGETLTISLSGNTIRMLINGVQKASFTNDNFVTATKHGISGNNSGSTIDNFTVVAN